ncbi:MAG TPA: FAD-dependent oxidoreductase [Chloroflexota bacterium]|nr:FAD-dependent oxidoreductase [Chloroflexota bacterium]
MTSVSPDVVIVGGGVMGCATAHYLSAAGVRVTLVEQTRVGGTPSASGASAAIVEALAGNPRPLALQAQLARRLLATLAPELLERTGIDIEWQRLGTLRLALTEREVGALRTHVAERYAELDETTEWVEAAELRRLEPALPERALGALRIPSTNGLYAPKYVRALASSAALQGATVLQGVSVTGFLQSGGRVTGVETSEGTLPCGQVVLASGAWTGVVSRWLGRPLPVEPQRGQIMALQPAPGRPRVGHVVHGPGGYVIPKANGTAAVGATHEHVGFDARVTTYGLKHLADLALRLAPGLETAALKHAWAGFRPVLTEERLPLVGDVPGVENACVAAGHGAIGVTVSAAVGYLLAQRLRGEEPEQSLEAFRL